MENESFIMLPNKIVWNHENREDTYLFVYGDKILHIFSYLNGMTNRFGRTVFTINHMITSCGLTPKSGKIDKSKKFDKVGMTNQFKEILIDLKLKGIIETEIDFHTVKVKDAISCIFNMPILKTEKEPIKNINFFNIAHSNYLEIIKTYNGKLNKLTLLKVYYYINARLSRRKIVIIEGKVMSNDIQCCGGKAETFYDSYSAIVKELGIAEDTWCTYIKELNSLELLFYDNIGIVRKGSTSHTANNVYCISQNEIKEALKQSELYYISDGYTILGKKTDKETKIISGTRGKIQQEKNRNKDTSKLENKLEKLESNKSKKNNPNDMFKIKTLLEEHEGEILSSIWSEFNEKTADKWFDIEVSLGLVKDNTDDLLVDYEEYKWVVMNYDKSNHDYYVNIVKKYIRESNKPKGKGLFGAGRKPIELGDEPSEYLGIKADNSFKERQIDIKKIEELEKFVIKVSTDDEELGDAIIKRFGNINLKPLKRSELDKACSKIYAFIKRATIPF